jgi:hypothetical protein
MLNGSPLDRSQSCEAEADRQNGGEKWDQSERSTLEGAVFRLMAEAFDASRPQRAFLPSQIGALSSFTSPASAFRHDDAQASADQLFGSYLSRADLYSSLTKLEHFVCFRHSIVDVTGDPISGGE